MDLDVNYTKKRSRCSKHIPSEVLVMIFKNLDDKSLLRCWSVSKQWRDVADYVIQNTRDWKVLAKRAMTDGGRSFQRKSNLQWRDIYMNYLLWWKVKEAKILPVYRYEVGVKIFNVNVYRNTLIVVFLNTVRFYCMETYKLTDTLNIMSCYDLKESDYIVVLIGNYRKPRYMCKTPYNDINLFYKYNINDRSLDDRGCEHINNMLHYSLEDNICYIITTDNNLCEYRFQRKRWTGLLRAKFFGNTPRSTITKSIISMSVHRSRVYILLNTGQILFNDKSSDCFNKLISLALPCGMSPTPPLMFRKCSSIVYGVPSHKSSRIRYGGKKVEYVMQCSGLTCATQHGHSLFLGFEDGKVQICLPTKFRNPYRPDQVFYIQDYDKNTDCLEIKSLNVYEAKNCHHLLVATSLCVYQFLLSHANVP